MHQPADASRSLLLRHQWDHPAPPAARWSSWCNAVTRSAGARSPRSTSLTTPERVDGRLAQTRQTTRLPTAKAMLAPELVRACERSRTVCAVVRSLRPLIETRRVRAATGRRDSAVVSSRSLRSWWPSARGRIARRSIPRPPLPLLASSNRGGHRRRRTRRASMSRTATLQRGPR